VDFWERSNGDVVNSFRYRDRVCAAHPASANCGLLRIPAVALNISAEEVSSSPYDKDVDSLNWSVLNSRHLPKQDFEPCQDLLWFMNS
jgi:hypothetical protein